MSCYCATRGLYISSLFVFGHIFHPGLRFLSRELVRNAVTFEHQ